MDEPRHLLIDGYNVLFAWRWLRPGHETGPALDAARARLVDAVRAIHDGDSVAVTVVFDGRGDTIQRDAANCSTGVTVLFAPSGKTADTVIEQLVASAPDPHACTVATADALMRETTTAAGATCISPDDLRDWGERSRARAARAVIRRNRDAQATWGNRLPL